MTLVSKVLRKRSIFYPNNIFNIKYLYNVHYLFKKRSTIFISCLIHFSWFFFELHFFCLVFSKGRVCPISIGLLAFFPERKKYRNEILVHNSTRRLPNGLVKIAQIQIRETVLQAVRHFSHPHGFIIDSGHFFQIESRINAEVFQMEEIYAGF